MANIILSPQNGGRIGNFYNVKGCIVGSVSPKAGCLDIQVIGGDRIYNDVSYTVFEIDGGGDFASREEVLQYLQNNFFRPASGGGGGSQNLDEVLNVGNESFQSIILRSAEEEASTTLDGSAAGVSLFSRVLNAGGEDEVSVGLFLNTNPDNPAVGFSRATEDVFIIAEAQVAEDVFAVRTQVQYPIVLPAAQFDNEAPTWGQTKTFVQTRQQGGYYPFTADGIESIVTIFHGMDIDNGDTEDPNRYRPEYFTLTTTTPITINHLNRVVSFETPDTMTITFQNAPLPGEDVEYCWSITK